MKSDPTPLRQTTQRQVEETNTAESLQGRTGLEFESAEALLRHDRAQTVVPESLARRLAAEAENRPSTSTPWWRRWF
jgi:hypothetical protein